MGALFLAVGIALVVFGADPIAAFLLPGLPAPYGALALYVSGGFIACLVFPPTRFLAQNLILGILKGLVVLVKVGGQVGLSACRIVVTAGHAAWNHLWSSEQ